MVLFWYSWEVDKMDMECDETRWTFYINPKKRDTIQRTVQVKPAEEASSQKPEQAAEETSSQKPATDKEQANLQTAEKSSSSDDDGDDDDNYM